MVDDLVIEVMRGKSAYLVCLVGFSHLVCECVDLFMRGLPGEVDEEVVIEAVHGVLSDLFCGCLGELACRE